MKNLCLALATILIADVALADQFQFSIGSGSNGTYASYASVRILTSDNREVFKGFADRFGRVAIAVPPGQYQAVVVTQGREMRAPVRLTGANGLKPITLH